MALAHWQKTRLSANPSPVLSIVIQLISSDGCGLVAQPITLLTVMLAN